MNPADVCGDNRRQMTADTGGERMLKKEQLERLLTEAMDSGADFAEIFEEDAVS